MTTPYLVDVTIKLKPVYHAEPPEICVGVNGSLTAHTLEHDTDYSFKFYSHTASMLQVEFLNKKSNDTVTELGLDKAVVIESVSFFGITDPRFAWAGIYEPRHGGVLTPHTYLSWNGTWTLNFDMPVFTWMHKIQALGWVYQ